MCEGGWFENLEELEGDDEEYLPTYGVEVIRFGDIPKILEDHADLVALYFDCKAWSVLPYQGGWLDQPSHVYDAFTLFDAELARRKPKGRRNARNG